MKGMAIVAFVFALTGCAGTEGAYHVHNATGQPIPNHALADEFFLDGTGPTGRKLAPNGSTVRYVPPALPATPMRRVARSQPAASEPADITSSTTGVRSSVQGDTRTFNEWLEDERREDARMRSIMDICRC